MTKLRITFLIALMTVVAVAGVAQAKTPDGETPAEESVCDGESGAAFGLCNAYCEAMDCDLLFDGNDSTQTSASEKACLKVLDNYIKVTAKTSLPCDGADCPPVGSANMDAGLGCPCEEDGLDCAADLVCFGDDVSGFMCTP